MPDPDVLDLMEGSALSFAATVVAAGAATTGTVPATERTAIVRVTEVLHAPAAFGYPGRRRHYRAAGGRRARTGRRPAGGAIH